jgi:hypothetical protein
MILVHVRHRQAVLILAYDKALISGHPDYCPHPVLVSIVDSHLGWVNREAAFRRSGHALKIPSPGIRSQPRYC